MPLGIENGIHPAVFGQDEAVLQEVSDSFPGDLEWFGTRANDDDDHDDAQKISEDTLYA